MDVAEKVDVKPPPQQSQSSQPVISGFLELSWRERMRAKKGSYSQFPWVMECLAWDTREAE